MSVRRLGLSALLMFLLLCAGTLALVALPGATKEEIRDIRLVARGVTFYVDGRPEPNPTLRVRAGEQVRFSFRNEDRGLAHDFAVSAWSLTHAFPRELGRTASIVVRVPDRPGRHAYTCTPHAALMHGIIEVGP